MKFVLALLTLTACSTTSGLHHGMEKGSPCASDLVQGDYVGDMPSAETYCRDNSPSEITVAKNLKDGHYVSSFDDGLAKSKGYSEAQITCAKQNFDANPGSELEITISCMQ
jgi:hypothetical protein